MAIDRNAPHDSLVKELLGAPGNAAAVLQTVLPHEICVAIDWASLESDDSELAAPQGARTHTDLLFRAMAHVDGDRHEIKVLVVIEHQSTEDWTMPVRMLNTLTGVWRRSLRQSSGQRPIPLVLPILMCHTSAEWGTSRQLEDMFAVRPAVLGLERYTPSLEVLIVDLGAERHGRLLAPDSSAPSATSHRGSRDSFPPIAIRPSSCSSTSRSRAG